MSQLWNQLLGTYSKILENGDPRVKNWALMSSPLPTLLICLTYGVLVKYVGPAWMVNRKPFNLRYFMMAYNLLMTILSFYIFYGMGIYGWFGKYDLKCQPVDYSNHPDALGMVYMCYWYYLSKFIEFTDTIFFVLRKKTNHVSTLHVIHHGIMPLSVWWGLKFCPGGHSTFFSFINSFVHVLMYVYYFLAALGPEVSKYLWWKKHITTIQMIQFVLIFVHQFQLMFRDCNYPRAFVYWIALHAILFWFLFMDFYKRTYQRKVKHSNKNGCNGTKKD